jgi:hypothetical protein
LVEVSDSAVMGAGRRLAALTGFAGGGVGRDEVFAVGFFVAAMWLRYHSASGTVDRASNLRTASIRLN